MSNESGMITTSSYTNFHDDAAAKPETNIIEYVYNYSRPFVWALGSIGNILSCCVFSRKTFHHTLTGFLFRWLAVFDFIVVQEHLESMFILYGIDLVALQPWSCRVLTWLFESTKLIAIWLLIAISFERLVAVVMPLKAKTLCTVTKGKMFLSLLIVCSLGIFCHYLLAFDTRAYYDGSLGRYVNNCYPRRGMSVSLQIYTWYISPWLKFWLYAVVPFILVITSNIIIIIGLRRHAIKRQTLMIESSCGSQSRTISVSDSVVDKPAGGRTGSKQTSMTAMLLTVSLAFVILTTPWCTYLVLQKLYRPVFELHHIGYVLMALHHAMNFILYCLSGRRFRLELKHLIFCR